MRSAVLTDDEVVALGAGASQPWPSPVPTVDVTDETQVVMSAGRGARSLLVRGLLNEEGELSPESVLGQIVGSVLKGGLTLAAYVTGPDFAYLRRGFGMAQFAGPAGGGIAEVITPGGIHYLEDKSMDATIAVVRELLHHCFSDGAAGLIAGEEDAEALYVCVVRHASPGSSRFAAVRKGEILVRTLGEDSDASTPSSLDSVSSVFEFLKI